MVTWVNFGERKYLSKRLKKESRSHKGDLCAVLENWQAPTEKSVRRKREREREREREKLLCFKSFEEGFFALHCSKTFYQIMARFEI